jgi:hypothetical protein
MPIRFYCPFCDQLLGIARRKAGAVVECPSCHGKVGVPSETAPPAPPPAPPEWLVPVPPRSATPSPSRSDIVLTPTQVVAVLVALGLLLGLSFTAGLLVGAMR